MFWLGYFDLCHKMESSAPSLSIHQSLQDTQHQGILTQSAEEASVFQRSWLTRFFCCFCAVVLVTIVTQCLCEC